MVQYNTILLGPLVLYFCVMAMSERELASDTKIVMATGRPTPDAKVLAAHPKVWRLHAWACMLGPSTWPIA